MYHCGHFIVQLSGYASQHMAIDWSTGIHAKVTHLSIVYPCKRLRSDQESYWTYQYVTSIPVLSAGYGISGTRAD
jgi:hypothetical protein